MIERGEITKEKQDIEIDKKLNEAVELMYRYNLPLSDVYVWLNKAKASFRFLQLTHGFE